MAREGKRVGGERKQVPITLSICEFMKRWCLHILPEQLTRTRYFGGWSNNRSVKYMARCEDFYDRYQQTLVESEKETAAQGPPSIQGYLPGLTPGVGYEIYSF